MSGALRRVPSPLHGTSHKIRSKYNPFVSSSDISVSTIEFSVDVVSKCPLLSFNPGKSCASWLVTTMFGLHMRLVWWINRWHLFTSESLATTCTRQAKDSNVTRQLTNQLRVSSKSIKKSILHSSNAKNKGPQEKKKIVWKHTMPSESSPGLTPRWIISNSWKVLDPGAAHTAAQWTTYK